MTNSDPWTSLRPHQLRDLLAVVDAGSLRAGARRLGLTQPSLTKSLRQLEAQLAIPLLVRSAHGVTLTSAGERLVEHARSIESQLRRAAKDLDLLRAGTGASVSVGISPAVSIGFFAEAVNELRLSHPGVSIRVLEGVHERLVADVRQGVVDFALMPISERSHLTDLRIRPLFETRVVAIGRTGHPSSGARGLADLAQCDWITTRRNGTLDRLIDRAARSLGLPPFKWQVECASSLTFIDLVAQTDVIGLALATKLLSGYVQANGISVILDGPPLPVVSVVLVHRPDMPPRAVAGALASQCRRSVSKYIRPIEQIDEIGALDSADSK